MKFHKSPVNSAILALFIAGCASAPQKMPDNGSTTATQDIEHNISEQESSTIPKISAKETSASQKISVKSSTNSSKKEPTVSSEEKILLTAENKATFQGQKILKVGRQMALINGEIIRGGCWDYANAVYNRAGYPDLKGKRQIVFKGSKGRKSYADVSLIQQGDFLYYINHSYHRIEHSAIFVDWLDYHNKIGLMLSYGGEKRRETARYLPYDLSNVYRIVRAAN